MTGFGELGIAWPLRDVAWMGAFGAPCPFRLGPRSQYGAGPGITDRLPRDLTLSHSGSHFGFRRSAHCSLLICSSAACKLRPPPKSGCTTGKGGSNFHTSSRE